MMQLRISPITTLPLSPDAVRQLTKEEEEKFGGKKKKPPNYLRVLLLCVTIKYIMFYIVLIQRILQTTLMSFVKKCEKHKEKLKKNK